jgi:hypothetical protein
VPESAQALFAALVRIIFVHPDMRAALVQLNKVAETLQSRFPQAGTSVRAMADDLLAFMSFPAEHWRQTASPNPLERLNREIGRRTDVVEIFRTAGPPYAEPARHPWNSRMRGSRRTGATSLRVDGQTLGRIVRGVRGRHSGGAHGTITVVSQPWEPFDTTRQDVIALLIIDVRTGIWIQGT